MAKRLLGALATLSLIWASACAHQSAANVETAAAAPVTKPAYMVVMGTVTNMDAFMAGYASKLGPVYEKYGGQYLSIGGTHEVLEGETGFKSHVISVWPGGIEDARAFWASPEYETLKKARIDGGWGTFDVFLVDGLPAQATAAEKSQ